MSESVLFILLGGPDKASSRVRGYWIADELENLGYDCTLRKGSTGAEILLAALSIFSHDIIIFQKTYSRYHRYLMRLCLLLGKTAYMDIDDFPSRTNNSETISIFSSMARMADGVFVGCEALSGYVAQTGGQVHLIPTGIKTSNYKVANTYSANDEVCIGWVGNGAHYENDLRELIVEPLKDICQKYKIRLKLVGTLGRSALHELFADTSGLAVEFVENLQWDEPEMIMRELSDFDIGIYPLLNNDFNNYKCGFKALEYMAMGIPFVASSNSANDAIVAQGECGYCATCEEDWKRQLELLTSDPLLRKKMGQCGRLIVENNYDSSRIARRISHIFSGSKKRVAAHTT